MEVLSQMSSTTAALQCTRTWPTKHKVKIEAKVRSTTDVEDQTTEAMRRSQTTGEESTLVCGDPKQMVQIIYGVEEKTNRML